MMANAPFNSGASSLLEDLNGPDNGMQQINSELSSLSFSPAISKGVIEKPVVPMSPMSSTVNMNSSFSSFVPQDESPYYPSSPMSPVFRHPSIPHMARAQSLGDDPQRILAPRNNNFAASPVIHSKRTFSSSSNNATVSSLGVHNQSSPQYSSGVYYNNHQHHDTLASSVPPPPNLDASDALHQIGRLENSGLFLSENDTNNQPKSPFVATQKINRGNALHDTALTRERALSSSGVYLRQPSFGAPTPASGQILYEDKPSSWNEASGFPSTPSCPHNGEGGAIMPSPSNFDRFNSRPPRHSSGIKETATTQALLSPRIQIRHAASDGNFNFPTAIPLSASYMGPATNNNHVPTQSNSIPSNAVGSLSFEPTVQAGIANDRNSVGSMDALNPNMNFLQYQVSHTPPLPPGIVNNSSVNIQQDNNCYVQQPPVPVPLGLQRHNSTGSQHFLVNERGEIIGHASPVVAHNTLEGFAQGGETRNRFPGIRPQRSNSYGGQKHIGRFNPIQPQQGLSPPIFSPITFQSEGANDNDGSRPIENNHVGSIGDGRVHHRHNTEPTPPAIFNQNSGGNNIHSRHPSSATTFAFEQAFAGENVEGFEAANEEIRGVSSGMGRAVEEKGPSSQSYASKLMMPCPQPATDPTKGRGVSSQLLTAGAGLAKSGPRMIFNVKFKRSQRNFVLGQRVAREIKIGCYVKVEADRGEDLGIVMSIVPMEKYLSSNRRRSMTEDTTTSEGDPPSPAQSTNVGDLKRIMRVATHDEISLLEVKREEEEELLKICCTKVRQRGLPMSVVDAEYQFDRNKLTFFFQAEGRIDFRELVRDLFSMYKTRIWMQQLDKNGSPDEDHGNPAEE